MGEGNTPPEMGGNFKSRQCMFVLYPESQQATIDYCQAHLPCAWALHDKDVYSKDAPDGSYKKGDPKKPHIHFVCNFKNPRWFSGIAKELGVKSPVIRRVNSLYDAYTYLWHEGHLDKYQYSASIVGKNEAFEVPSEHYGMSSCEDEQIKVLLDMPYFDTFSDMARWAYDNGCWASFRKNYTLWRDIFIEARRKPDKEPVKMFADFMPLNPQVPDPFTKV